MRGLLLWLLTGCTATVAEVDTDVADEVEPADLSAVADAMDEALVDNPVGIEGMALLVFDSRTDAELLRHVSGSFDTNEVIPVASASKLVTGLVLLRLVDQGVLSLDDTAASVLDWREGGITLDHLGAFVSGLPPEALCTFNPRIELQACVEAIGRATPLAQPGARLEYGGTHQHVAAGMAEVASGQDWANLFDEQLRTSLDLLGEDQVYVTLPRQPAPTRNPLVAGGLRTSTDAYVPFLRLVAHDGRIGEEAFIDAALIDRMFVNRYPDAEVGDVPGIALADGWRYSWSSWLFCPGPVERCEVMGSPGAFGFTPWVDREHGYYAILAMETPEPGGAAWATPLAVELGALIERALTD